MKACNYSGPCKVCGNNKALWFVDKKNDELCVKCATTIIATGKPPALPPPVEIPANLPPIAPKGPVVACIVAPNDAPSFDINDPPSMDICYKATRFDFIEIPKP